MVDNGLISEISFEVKAAILFAPKPDGFEYPRITGQATGFATVATRQSYIINAAVDDFVPDREVELIKQGNGKALHVWGEITYKDIFGDIIRPSLGNFSLGWLMV